MAFPSLLLLLSKSDYLATKKNILEWITQQKPKLLLLKKARKHLIEIGFRQQQPKYIFNSISKKTKQE